MPHFGRPVVVLKLRRAEDHLTTLDRWIVQFLESDFCEVEAETDARGRVVFRVTRVDPTPPEWGVLIGEVLYNLRSALDHLAFELAVLKLGRPLPPKIEDTSAFPVFDSGPEISEAKKERGTCSGKRLAQDPRYAPSRTDSD